MARHPIRSFLALLVLLVAQLAGLPAAGEANTITPGFTVGGYTLVSKVRSTRTAYDMTFSANVTNTTGRGAVNVAATVTSLKSTVEIVDGNVSFGAVGKGTLVKSADSFTLRVSATYTVNEGDLRWTVAYAPENRPPVMVPMGPITINEGDALKLTPVATDPDGDPVFFTYSGWLTSNTYETSFEDAGLHTVRITAADSYGASASQEVAITVADVNRPPRLDFIPPVFAVVGDQIQLDPKASDPDLDPLTIQYSGWLEGNRVTTTALDIGSHVVTVTVEDGRGGIATQNVEITVTTITTVATFDVSPSTDTIFEGAAGTPLDGLRISVPAGALSVHQTIEVGYLDSPPSPADSPRSLGKTFFIGPHGLRFEKPIFVELTYDNAERLRKNIVSEASLAVFSFTPSEGVWKRLDTVGVEGGAARLIGSTNHLSYFTILGDFVWSQREGKANRTAADSAHTHASAYYPVLFVHGIQNISDGYKGNSEATFGKAGELLAELVDPSDVSRDKKLDVWYFDYSTHLEIERAAYSLGDAISYIVEHTGTTKVVIIAHSLGGVVARTYLQGLARWTKTSCPSSNMITTCVPTESTLLLPYLNNVKKLMMFGTPNQGAQEGTWAGTACSYVAFGEPETQMKFSSDFLVKLNGNKEALPKDVSYSNVLGNACLRWTAPCTHGCTVDPTRPQPRPYCVERRDDDGVIKNWSSDMSTIFTKEEGWNVETQWVVYDNATKEDDYYHTTLPSGFFMKVKKLCGDTSGVSEWKRGIASIDSTDHLAWPILEEFVTHEDAKRPPVFQPILPKTVAVGSGLSFDVKATHPAGDAISLSTDNLPTGATFDDKPFSHLPGTETYTFTWVPDAAGTYEVTFRASDGIADPVTITVKISVTPSATLTDPVTGMEFVWVPAGTFEMGDTFGDGYAVYGELPVHTVTLTNGFYLGKYEVTQAQWQAVMGSNPSYFQPSRGYASCPTCPVEEVSWNDIQTFLAPLNASRGKTCRLPTEAEWEYAARSGGKRERFAGMSDWGQIGNYAWYHDNSGGTTHPVGGKLPNGLGLCDMSGNVNEWVQDWFGTYPSTPQVDPTGAVTGTERGFRGGIWGIDPPYVRVAYRIHGPPDARYYNTGFRLVCEP